MSEHILKAFDAELDAIAGKVMQMGARAEAQAIAAVQALADHDAGQGERIIAADAEIDRLQREVEETAILALARHQPMAVDLRAVVTAIRIAGDLERIGDYAKNIGKRVISTAAKPYPGEAIAALERMGELVVDALTRVLAAYARRDADEALAVWQGDAEIDEVNDALFRDMLDIMARGGGDVSVCAHLMFCAKNLERIGDHATNIAETVYYVVRGAPLPERPTGGDEEK